MESQWVEKFKSAVANVGDGMSYQQAADKLRKLIQSNLLTLTDITDNPERFFLAHKLLSLHSTRLGPGFSIRFTVHYNLFAGTVVGLGSDEQIKQLVKRNSDKPRLGCFALTEVLAGVNSGLVVNTTAVFHDGKFVINTPNEGAAKNWISQGLVADEGVVVASLVVKGKQLGPQAFLVKLRNDDGSLVKGFDVQDMGIKTVGNDLDNGRLRFTQFEAPLDSLLCRYLTVDREGNVGFPQGSTRTMDMIGQRLFSGRIAVGQAALEFAKSLFASTKLFCEKKPCWAPGGSQFLINVPQVRALFIKADKQFKVLDQFMQYVESRLCEVLRKKQVPPVQLQQSIAVAKVKCIEESIALCHALKQEVGSFALMAGTGFEQMDFLQCCKFAEGDSRILMQKMARDVVAQGPTTALEKQALSNLKNGLEQAIRNGAKKRDAWDVCWELVYQLAEAHMTGVLEQTIKAKL